MSSSLPPRLHVLGSDQAPAELPREGMLVVGSSASKAGVVLSAQGVSEVHCAIGRTKDGGWAIKDLGSEYGTLLNGNRITQARLKPGDQLLLGSARLEVRAADSSSEKIATKPTRPAATPTAPKEKAKTKKKAAAAKVPFPKLQGYRVIERLGSGAMGEVFLAVQESLDREVALKVLSKKLEADKMFVQSFQAEARSAAALNHPNVVTVHDVGEQDGVHYLTMEYMDRGSLEDRVAKQGPLHWRAAVDALHDAASGLVYAESRGIVHRDIKPDNLMQNHTGTTKIADLGLATHVNEDEGEGNSKIFGTPHFISPEQVRGEKADCRSDLYSLGATAFRLLTGHTPFEGETTREIVRAKLNEDPAPLRRYVTDLPEGLVQVVERLLRRDPAERYPSASALLKEFDALRNGRDAAQVGAPPADSGKLHKFALPIGLGLLALASLPFFLAGDDPAAPPVEPLVIHGTETNTPADDEGAEDLPEDDQAALAIDDDAQEKFFEIEAENEFLKLSQRDLDKATRRDRLRELATRFRGTTVATTAEAEAEKLDGEILAEARALQEHDTQLSSLMSALQAAAALDSEPFSVGNSLRAMAAVPGQELLAEDPAFLAARAKLENEVVAAALSEFEAAQEAIVELQAQGDFDAARIAITELIGRTALPDFDEGRAPLRSAEILALRSELRARLEGLAGAEEDYNAALALGDVRSLLRVVGGEHGLREPLTNFDFSAAATRVAALAEGLALEENRSWAEQLRDDLESAEAAFSILSSQWSHWRRKSVPDPRTPRGTSREALGATGQGLELNVKGEAQELPWSAYAGHSRLISTLFKDRLDRRYTPEEQRSIAALLRFSAISDALRESAEMFDSSAGAVFTEREAQDLPKSFEFALEWEQDPDRHALLEREQAAAILLATALRAGSEEDWTSAVSTLEQLFAEYSDTLFVRIHSDGSSATPAR